jgi:hypothetical protein
MKLIFRGWRRNCGEKAVLSREFDPNMLTDTRPLYLDQVQARLISDEQDAIQGIEIRFGKSISLGGDHLGCLRFSTSELAQMLNACCAAREPERKPNLRVV